MRRTEESLTTVDLLLTAPEGLRVSVLWRGRRTLFRYPPLPAQDVCAHVSTRATRARDFLIGREVFFSDDAIACFSLFPFFPPLP